MRFKMNRGDQSIYTCCFCCHVRTGTIFLGIFTLFAELCFMSMYAVVALHPELVNEAALETMDHVYDPATDSVIVRTENSSSVMPRFDYNSFNWFKNGSMNDGEIDDKFLFLLLTVGIFTVTIMLVYGAAKGRSSYLMPFFCLQVFDFSISCLMVVGYFSYIPDIRAWVSQMQESYPLKEWLLSLDDDWLMLLAILFFVSILTVKAYFLGMVWACYKFLTAYERNLNTAIHRGYQGDNTNPEDAEMLLPPKYEDAINIPVTSDPTQPPPPPYSAN
ncbi:hypothetical protein CAPTEDRAFT_159544 [Capitella teleta]|uniref:Lysosomal-associated transmembrane protein 4A n=1 Tax=Capitella teleta TaxID=283909 RepID=R7T4N5_CAPTE|nr:hypothetical protein CAPTEDRAFT_159544 [Capitella teleta]|eukprot:ELT88022.1 hypothetical protein CAPTEDRAFT_159544 [Capitella teleta]